MPATTATLVSINIAPEGGVPKRPVPAARLRAGGVEGDRQRHLQFHGGPQRAVCLYSLELIEALRTEGHPIEPGSTGENLTVSGLDWAHLVPGTGLQVGEALLEITSYTSPCEQIAASFCDGSFKRISQKLHPGWSRVYARVVREAAVQTGDAVRVVAPASGPVQDQRPAEDPLA